MPEQGVRRNRSLHKRWIPYVGLAALLVLAVVLVPLAVRTQDQTSAAPVGRLSPAPERPRTVFIGDSSVAGAGASAEQLRWSTLTSRALGWDEVNVAEAGRGYGPPSRRSCDTRPSCASYSSLVPDVVSADPQVVVVGGGGNAVTAATDQQAAQVASFFQALRLGLPDATIIAVGPWSAGGRSLKATKQLDSAVRSSAGAVGAAYVSLLAPAVVTEGLATADGTRLRDRGHQEVASRVISDLDSEDN